jgi:hypothetical protein
MAYSSTYRASFSRFSDASNGWFSEQRASLSDPQWTEPEPPPPPRVSWFRRALLSTFVVLVVAAAASFLIYALAHGDGMQGELSRSALRAVGVPQPVATRSPSAIPAYEPTNLERHFAGQLQVVQLELGSAAPEIEDPIIGATTSELDQQPAPEVESDAPAVEEPAVEAPPEPEL